MTTVMPTMLPLPESGGNPPAWVLQWATMHNGDQGAQFDYMFYHHADRSVQLAGTFGSGGTCIIEGSNDGTNYATLSDTGGNALSLTAAAMKAITEVPRYIRPRISAGDGTTAITVTMLLRRTTPQT
jgi:hypothetical protein